jgi:hypothetical protein
MRFHRSIAGLALVTLVTLVAGGCGARNPVAPEMRADPGSETFVIDSALDPRLPAAGLEASAATPEDQALLDRLQAPATAPVAGVVSNPAVYWNQVTTVLGRAAALPPPLLARDYALVQVAVFDALVASRHHLRGRLPAHAVAAGSASRVLAHLFPQAADRITDAAAEQVALDGPVTRRTLDGFLLGRAVGRLVVRRAKNDGSDTPFTGTLPSGDGIWTGTDPVLPMCGTWKTWVLTSGSEIQPEPPYAFGSAEDLADVQEVSDLSLHRTPEQIDVVHRWADLPPPTIWNHILARRIEVRDLGVFASARAYAYLNVAMADGFISCWQTKYTYWIARPFQRIPGLTTVIPTPNFPSYTSGHSTISAAAAVVLGEVFPGGRERFAAQAEEAALSRLWAGIHFRHDNEQGLAMGRAIGARVVERMQIGGRIRLAAGQ